MAEKMTTVEELPQTLVDEIASFLVELSSAPSISRDRAGELRELAKALVVDIRQLRAAKVSHG